MTKNKLVKKPKFYWAVLSNGLSKVDCQVRKSRSLVPKNHLMIIPVDGRFRLVRKIYLTEFGTAPKDQIWRDSVRRYHHPRVLRWLKKARLK